MFSGCPRCAGLCSRHRGSRPRPWLSAGDTNNHRTRGSSASGLRELPSSGSAQRWAPQTAQEDRPPSAAPPLTPPPLGPQHRPRSALSGFRQNCPHVAALGFALPAGGSGPGAAAAEVSGPAAALLRAPGVGGVDLGGAGSGVPAWRRAPRLGVPRGAPHPGPQCPGRRGARASACVRSPRRFPSTRDVIQAGITRTLPCPWRGRIPRWGGSRGWAVNTWTNKETSGSGRCHED